MALITERTLLEFIKTSNANIFGTDVAISGKIGEKEINPEQFTIMDRLKNIETNTGGGSSNFTALNSTNVDASKINLDNSLLAFGEVQASPTQYTMLERLKTIADNIGGGGGSSTGTYGQVTLNTDPKLVVASNVNRLNCLIEANASNTSKSYLGYDNTVSSTNYFASLNGGDVYSQDSYLGDIFISNATATDKVNFGEV